MSYRGRLACKLGLHRWEFRDEQRSWACITFARCRRGCERYSAEMVVNVDRHAEADTSLEVALPTRGTGS